MSSITGLADSTADTPATEFALEKFEITISESTVKSLAADTLGLAS
jgi:hypothetical protein